MKVLVTGGCGFIGSHFVKYLLNTDSRVEVVNLDALTYAAHPDTEGFLSHIAPDRYQFIRADIASSKLKTLLIETGVTHIVNFAAESHVDRSILDPGSFVQTNVVGVQNLLNCAREAGDIRFVQVSTDEVYGTLEPTDPPTTEKATLSPNSPYAASKASADLFALACERTYHQDVVITRCSNNFGPMQFPEKLIPLVIANALEGRSIPVYGDGQQVRDWIYVVDHCQGIDRVMRNGKTGEVYNISSNNERNNLDVIHEILDSLGKPRSLIQFVGDRPAHDRRYSLDSTRIRTELGWTPDYSFDDGIDETLKWYVENSAWWKKVRDKDYLQYYQANYANKFEETESRL